MSEPLYRLAVITSSIGTEVKRYVPDPRSTAIVDAVLAQVARDHLTPDKMRELAKRLWDTWAGTNSMYASNMFKALADALEVERE